MAKLVNYGVGELVDRLTILALKLQHVDGDGKHFLDERNALLTQLAGRTLNGAWFEHTLTLAAVNARLWHAEDELRGLRNGKVNAESVAVIAFKIQELNDQRAFLVDEINKLTGDFRGREKC